MVPHSSKIRNGRDMVSTYHMQKARVQKADYTVMGMEFAVNLLLISRASSDAYEPYVFLKGHSEKSSNPDGQNDLL